MTQITKKEQEKEALRKIQKIREIINDLGEHNNILSKEYEEVKAKLDDVQEEKAKLELELDELQKKYDSLVWQLKELKCKTMSGNDLLYLAGLLSTEIERIDSVIEKAAERMVEFADQPSQHEFTAAVEDHRSAIRTKKEIQNIQSRLDSCITCISRNHSE